MSVSLLTEKAIAAALKSLMETKPFEKITVSDITDECSLNRQTFYYHFQDKYELLNWIYQSEIVEPFAKDINLDNWNEHLLKMFVIMKNESTFYKNAFSHSNEEFKLFLLKQATNVFRQAAKKLQIKAKKHISEDDEIFISEFFAYGISGIIMSWVKNGMKESPQELAKRLENLVSDCHKISIDRYFGSI